MRSILRLILFTACISWPVLGACDDWTEAQSSSPTEELSPHVAVEPSPQIPPEEQVPVVQPEVQPVSLSQEPAPSDTPQLQDPSTLQGVDAPQSPPPADAPPAPEVVESPVPSGAQITEETHPPTSTEASPTVNPQAYGETPASGENPTQAEPHPIDPTIP